jgi:hypothetical protein
MLRPSNSLLGSSKATRRANLRAERLKSLGHAVRGFRGLFTGVFGAVFGVVFLWAVPFVYLAAAYLALDLPARWLTHRPAWGAAGALIFFAAFVICIVGLARASQQAVPVAPVRPQFAKAMLALSWVAALLFTIGDLAS